MSRETTSLVLTLAFFDVAYVLRAWWDFNCFGIQPLFYIWSGAITLTLIFDILPLGLILLFHFKNFRVVKQQGPAATRQSKTSRDMNLE